MGTTESKVLQGVIDPSHSRVQFKVKHLMISNVLGSFKEFEGKATMVENDFSSAVVSFSINTASIDTEAADRDAHLKSVDFFDVENFPKIDFEGKGMTQKDEENYELKGNLTIKGISKPVTLSVEFGGLMTDPWGNKKAGFSVTGDINRKDWGMVWNAALETGGVLVSDKVKILCDVEFFNQLIEAGIIIIFCFKWIDDFILNNIDMILNNQNKLFQSTDNTDHMPVLFVGHGSPMYVIEENEFTRTWHGMGETIPTPKAILCISAHWETRGTQITAMPYPLTIHDFGGFPRELYEIKYPAPGNPELANEIIHTIQNSNVQPDNKWGLDHGAWSVIMRMYPKAEIPVLQMSLDYNKTPEEHYELAKELAAFRDNGILIIGSGNMVHNLHKVAWDKPDDEEYGLDWALEANELFKKLILSNHHKELINYQQLGKAVQMAVPTPDHYLPLLYALALKNENETVSFFNDKAVMGSLTMTSLKIG